MDIAKRNQLVEAHMNLAAKVAKDLWDSSSLVRRLGQLEDVISVARLALIKVIRSQGYDKDHASGARLSTYLYTAMARCVRDEAYNAGVIRLNRYVLEQLSGQARRKHKLGDPAAVQAAWDCQSLPSGFDRPQHKDAPSEYEPLREALRFLSAADRELVTQMYGLDGQPEHTEKEMAALRGVSRQNINLHLHRAHERLRRYIARASQGEVHAAQP